LTVPAQLESLFEMMIDKDGSAITWQNLCDFLRQHQIVVLREEAMDMVHRISASINGIPKKA
jgi:hypothetical protein